MANILKFSTAEILINEINSICLENPQSEVAVWIKNKIEKESIPIQMDQDLMRRLTSPVCNPRDIAFEMPHALLTTDYSKINNQILEQA